jgi:ElaA protein
MEFSIKHFNELSNRELYEILKTRQEIFIIEQNCPYMDIDDLDLDAMHIFSMNEEGRVTACLRVFMKDEKTAQIGRVVTLVHGEGLGGKILHEGVKVALDHYKAEKIYLEAQTYAIGYYEKEGFRVISGEFDLDGIPHVEMERSREL